MTAALKDILFLDIETVRGYDSLDELPERLREAWIRKAAGYQRAAEATVEELYVDKAGIHAEFGNIIVIGMGFFHQDDENLTFRMKGLCGNDEHKILARFAEILSRFDQEELQLCAHNGKMFDFPYLSRRMLIQGIELPESLRLAGKKPWEIHHLDTMELWRFGDYRHFVSLELLATLFNIESSKTELDGSQVGSRYYLDGDVASIAQYCLRDVEVTARVYLHLTGRATTGFETFRDIELMKPDNNNE